MQNCVAICALLSIYNPGHWRAFPFSFGLNWRPATGAHFPQAPAKILLRAFFLLILLVSHGASLGCSGKRAGAESLPTSVAEAGAKIVELSEGQTVSIPCEARLKLGHLPRGGRRVIQFWLQYTGKDEIVIGPIETSCECLSVAVDTPTIPPGRKVRATATVDFTHDPTFAGALSLEGTVATAGKSPAFVVQVEVTVE